MAIKYKHSVDIDGDLTFSTGKTVTIPNGTTAQRPGSAAVGMFRYNTTTNEFEGYTGSTPAWGAIAGSGGGTGTVTVEKNVYTGDGSDVTFNTSTAIVSENNVQVYLDGVYQSKDNYTTSGNTVTMSTAPANNVSVELIHIVAVSGIIARDNFTGNGSTTAYVLTMSISNENATQVYLDGVYQSKDNYSTSGSTLTFSTAPPNGSVIEVIHMEAVDTSSLNQNNFTGDGSTTAFTLSASIDNETKTFVFIQGVYQEKSTYSIDGTTLTFSTAPQNGYTIEVMAFSTITIGNQGVTSINGSTGAVTLETGTDWQSTIKTSNFTAAAGKGYFVNTTSGEVTVTLPAGVVGEEVVIQDYARTFDTNSLNIVSNGSEKIQASTDDFTCSVENARIALVYQDATQGWTSKDILPPQPITVSYLVVAGGGSGGDGDWAGSGGGGGAGGLRTSYGSTSGGGASAESALTLYPSTNYTVTVGGGAAAASSAQGTDGSASVFHTISSVGGGGGARANGAGRDGGSGGGGGSSNAGAGTANQGYAGGVGYHCSPGYPNGGGGGASAAGAGQTSCSSLYGNGGAGLSVSITGSSVAYAGGGAMGRYGASANGGNGGSGGGGNAGAAGGTNLGGGGGGTSTGSASGAGGSGVVIIRYPNSNTVTASGGLTSSTTTSGSDKVTTFTAGTGTITFA
jgi:hypothetical protein